MRRFSIPAGQMMAPLMSQGYSSTPWTVTQLADSITWNTETFAKNQNANAIRFGTLYNFRFDADQPPNPTNATVGYFKTGSPTAVVVQAAGNVPLPSPRPHRQPALVPQLRNAYGYGNPNGVTLSNRHNPDHWYIVPGTVDIGNHGDDKSPPSRCPSRSPCTARPSLAQFVVQRQCAVHDHGYGLHQPMPAVDHPRLHHLPILGRPVFGH